MSKRISLSKGFVIYFIGNAGSKLIAILLLPLYTFYLSREQYGDFELANTAVQLFIPIIAMQMTEGLLRHLLDKDSKSDLQKVISSSLFVMLPNLLIFNFVYLAVVYFIDLYYKYYALIYFDALFFTFFLQRVARGLKQQKEFALSGLISSVTIILASVAFIVYGNMKTEGVLLSYFLGSIAAVVYLYYKLDLKEYIGRSYFDKSLSRLILKYSYPLLFDAVLWWMMNLSDRIMLGVMMSPEAVGIYGVANKFSAILIFFNSIFYLVWQEYSIVNSKEERSSENNAGIFNKLFLLQFSAVAVLIPLSTLLINNFIDAKFAEAWVYVPALMGGAVFASFSAFYGMKYQINKNTMGALSTSAIGGITNIILNLIFIPYFGIMAAAISTLISFALLWIVRLVNSDSFVNYSNVNYKTFVALLFYSVIIGIAIYYSSDEILYILTAASITLFFVLNRNIISEFLTKLNLKTG